jgi:serine protease Do
VTGGHVVRGWLGVSIQDLTPSISKGFGLTQTGGALVGQVESETPAEKAGIEAGDIIVSLDGQPLENSSQLRNRIAALKPNTKVSLGVLRGDKRMDINVTLGELKADDGKPAGAGNIAQRLGFAVSNTTSQLARQYGIDARLTGVVITSIDTQSAAASAGLREGDLIQSVFRKPVENESEFYDAVKNVAAGETVLLRIYREGGGFFVAFKMD